MKTLRKILRIMILSGVVFSFYNCEKENNQPTENDLTKTLDSTGVYELTDIEKEDLIHLREEEKLARDVYLYAYEKYNLNVSKNISNSEQTHMDQVLEILTNNNIEDLANKEIGVFNIGELQVLYNQLITKVDSSELHALIVGATIEDLDIKDIDEFIERATNEEVINMYEGLKCGSRNHMRSYYSQITAAGSSYSPSFISQEDFESIINSDKEKCGQ